MAMAQLLDVPVGFLTLPRELRDLIYLAVITAERSTIHADGQLATYPGEIFKHVDERPPATCASLLACNQQIHEEMHDALRRAKEKGLLCSKLFCSAVGSRGRCYFRWLRIPLVKTTATEQMSPTTRPFWGIFALHLQTYQWLYRRVTGKGMGVYRGSTAIQQLWVDLRLSIETSRITPEWQQNLQLALFTALRHILEIGPDFGKHNLNPGALDYSPRTATVDELVLNVLEVQEPRDGREDGMKEKATLLMNMWNTLWVEPDRLGASCRILLERINRVRVCVDGETFRVRELALELERGQAERRRIGARLGY